MTEIYLAERSREQSRSALVELGISEALLAIKYNFELSQNPLNNLPYHNREHTKRVIGRTETILRTIQSENPVLVTDDDIELGKLATGFHDIVQDWEEVGGRRKRHTGENERLSAEIALYFMNRAKVFSDRDKLVVDEAINVTIPGFDPKLGTVTQPFLGSETSPVAVAVALADIGTCGMDGPDFFLGEGDALFREENLDILRALKDESLTFDQTESFRKRMLDWTVSQLRFVEGRQTLLGSDLLGIAQPARDKVKALFNKFEDSKEAIRESIEKRKNLPFALLVSSFGYVL